MEKLINKINEAKKHLQELRDNNADTREIAEAEREVDILESEFILTF
jgi:hypothetical protein